MKKNIKFGLNLFAAAAVAFSTSAMAVNMDSSRQATIESLTGSTNDTFGGLASNFKRSGRTSMGRVYGINYEDPIGLKASVALVVDQNSWVVDYQKNARVRLPIASITKLMTAMVTLDSGVNLNEYITITPEDASHYAGSRLTVGTTLPRRDFLNLALMSSDNRAAYILGRTFPGGLSSFVAAMNAKAYSLGMNNSQFVDPSGLNSENQATAMDLAKMLNAATLYPLIRQYSTSNYKEVATTRRTETYHNSNRLISRDMGWQIGMQKTGTLSAAGKCLVMQAQINGKPKLVILLDSSSSDSRVTDAVALKNYLEGGSNYSQYF